MSHRKPFGYCIALITLVGCTANLAFQPPMMYSASEKIPQPRVKPAARSEITGPHGQIETWYWDARLLDPASTKPAVELENPLASNSKRDNLPAAFILISGGNAMLAQHAGRWIEALYAGRDLGILAWNYPGHGSSTGPRSFQHTLDHALAVYDALRTRIGDRPIVLHGISIGSCPSAYVAANRPVAGVILEGPPQVAKIILSPRWGWWNLWIASTIFAAQVPPDFDPARSGARANPQSPLLVVQGENDTIVPPWCAQNIINAWPATHETLLLLPHVGHAPDPINTATDDYRGAIGDLLLQAGVAAPLQSQPARRR